MISDRGQRRGLAGWSPLSLVYLALAIIGLVGTWYFNLEFVATGNGPSYVAAWFANAASSSAAVDVIVTALVACVFYLAEGHRLGWIKWSWIFIPLTFALALAFAFPLFLALRQRKLDGSLR